jgi:hypothetical protein
VVIVAQESFRRSSVANDGQSPRKTFATGLPACSRFSGFFAGSFNGLA